MDSYDLVGFENPVTLANAAAEFWLKSLPPGNDSIGVAVSGGRIAKNFFQATTHLSQTTGADLSRVHFFWADERCVPPDHAESNFKLASDHMLEPLRIGASNIHRIRGEMDPAQASVQATEELRQWFSDSGSKQGIPILDYVFLGMGEDGHVASLFPDGPKPSDETGLFVSVTAAKPPPHRISTSYQMLQAAKEVLVLASGKGKANALTESLESNGDTPLARVLKSRSKTRIYTDIEL